MPEEWYQLLPKFLHFLNNKTFSKNSEARRLFRIQPVLEYFRSDFRNTYYEEALLWM
jgi:hypothetical protein